MSTHQQFPPHSGVTGFTRDDGTWQCTGSAIGRPSSRLTADSGKVTLRIRRVRLDSGGYDDGGAYWGDTGSHCLYQAYGTDGHGEAVEVYTRAADKKAAVERLTTEIRRCCLLEWRGRLK